VDRVHITVDQPGVLGQPWTDASADRGHDGMLTGAWPSAAPVRQSSSTGAQNGEGSEGNLAQVSPELGRRCGVSHPEILISECEPFFPQET
jgi:hypothetical protein